MPGLGERQVRCFLRLAILILAAALADLLPKMTGPNRVNEWRFENRVQFSCLECIFFHSINLEMCKSSEICRIWSSG